MNRIFITGDTHGKHDYAKLTNSKLQELSKNDYVIVCGDFGVLWKEKADNLEKQLIDWYNKQPWTTLFLDGNHENFNRIENLETEKKFNGIVGKVSDSIYHLKRGEVYTIGKRKFFVMGGASSVDKSIRKEFISWWRQEIPTSKEFECGLLNLENNNNKVDYILAHTAPRHMCYEILKHFGINSKNVYAEKLDCVTDYLSTVVNIVDFKKFYCGHWHCDWVSGKYRFLYDKIIELNL